MKKLIPAVFVLASLAHGGALKLATYPVRHPVKVAKVLTWPVRHPVKTVKTLVW